MSDPKPTDEAMAAARAWMNSDCPHENWMRGDWCRELCDVCHAELLAVVEAARELRSEYLKKALEAWALELDQSRRVKSNREAISALDMVDDALDALDMVDDALAALDEARKP